MPQLSTIVANLLLKAVELTESRWIRAIFRGQMLQLAVMISK